LRKTVTETLVDVLELLVGETDGQAAFAQVASGARHLVAASGDLDEPADVFEGNRPSGLQAGQRIAVRVPARFAGTSGGSRAMRGNRSMA
jgi:hypothetical protein